MMTRNLDRILLVSALLLAAMPVPSADAQGGFTAAYLYNLSNFTGTIPFTWVRVVVDEARNEVYVADGGSVHIFNDSGMEVYRFGEDDERLGRLHDVAALENGDLLVLSYTNISSAPEIVRCDYRGEPKERLILTGFPEGWAGFRPTRMVLRGEMLYLADLSAMKVAVMDADGALRSRIDLAAALKMDGQQVADSGLGGFDADGDENLYFTLPTQFKAYRLSAGGAVEAFGQPGSSPGKFGVIAGIAADRSGAIYIVDTLKCAVIAFDRSLRFLSEFGYRTARPGGLVAPKEVTVSDDGRLYVTQQANRGVTVYRVTRN